MKKFRNKIHIPSIKGGFQGKSLWEWLNGPINTVLLAGIAIIVTISGNALIDQQNILVQSQINIQAQQRQDDLLKAFRDSINGYLDRNLRISHTGDEIRNEIQHDVRDAFRELDVNHKSLFLRFLNDTKLIDAYVDKDGDHQAIILLDRMDLRGIDVSNMTLYRVVFEDSDMSGANFQNTILSGINFTGVNLGGARNLTYKQLSANPWLLQEVTLPDGHKCEKAYNRYDWSSAVQGPITKECLDYYRTHQ